MASAPAKTSHPAYLCLWESGELDGRVRAGLNRRVTSREMAEAYRFAREAGLRRFDDRLSPTLAGPP